MAWCKDQCKVDLLVPFLAVPVLCCVTQAKVCSLYLLLAFLSITKYLEVSSGPAKELKIILNLTMGKWDDFIVTLYIFRYDK